MKWKSSINDFEKGTTRSLRVWILKQYTHSTNARLNMECDGQFHSERFGF